MDWRSDTPSRLPATWPGLIMYQKQSGSAGTHVKPRASGQAAFVPRRTCGPGSGQVGQPDLTIRDVAVDAFCGEVIAGRIRGHVPDLMVLCELRNDVVPLDVRVGIGGVRDLE